MKSKALFVIIFGMFVIFQSCTFHTHNYKASDKVSDLEVRLNKIETIQDSYSNSIQFFSIFITVVLAVLVGITGLVVYKHDQRKHREHIDNQKKLEEQIGTHQNEIKEAKLYIEEQKKIIEAHQNEIEDAKQYIEEQKKIIEAITKKQEFYHFEIFDSLFNYEFSLAMKYSKDKDVVQALTSYSLALLYLGLAFNNTSDEYFINYYTKLFDNLITQFNAQYDNIHDFNCKIEDSAKVVINQNINNLIKECNTAENPKIKEILKDFKLIKLFEIKQSI